MMNIIVWIPAFSCFYDGVKEKLMTPVHVINIPACLEFTSNNKIEARQCLP